MDAVRGKTLIQKHGDYILVQNPPMPPLNEAEMDEVYSLPFMRTYHPSYEKQGGVPAISEVKFSTMAVPNIWRVTISGWRICGMKSLARTIGPATSCGKNER